MVTTAFGELPPSLARLQSPQSFRRRIRQAGKAFLCLAWPLHYPLRNLVFLVPLREATSSLFDP